MRNLVLSGVTALSLLAIGMTAMGATAVSRQADAEGSGASIHVSHRATLAMAEPNHNRAQSLLVADSRTASLARSLLVA